MHYAVRKRKRFRSRKTTFFSQAIHNRPIIIGMLILAGVDVNCKSFGRYGRNHFEIHVFFLLSILNHFSGGTPLHYACRHGSFDAVSCLLGNLGSIQFDYQGWSPIHHAAYCDHVPILRLLYNKHPELLEQTTDDKYTFDLIST